MKIDKNVIEVLSSAEIDGCSIKITAQLDRKLYQKVAKVLSAMGGKYVSAKKATVFPDETDIETTINNIIETGEFISVAKEFQFFPTPDDLAEKVVALANIKEGDVCLEPSAGRGNIAKYMPGCDCIEINSDNRKYLEENGFNVIHDDFMTFTPNKKYDVIVMNPPFCKGQDAKHILKAIEIAEKTVVAIAGGSVMFRQDKIYAKLREIVKKYNGAITELPQKSFKESGTNVETCLIIVRKGE